MTQSEHYRNLYKRLDEAERLFQAQLYMLRDQVFEERPQPHRWSVGECIRHVLVANEYYLKQIESKLPQAKSQADARSRRYKGGFLGSKLPAMLETNELGEVSYRMKAFGSFLPKPKNLPNQRPLSPDETKHAFEQQLARMKELLRRADAVPHRQVRIKSAIGLLLRFYLGDAFAFLIAHTERHLAQAEEVVRQIKERELR